MIKPAEYISDIKPYVPGKPIEELERELGIKDSVKLASNENPLGPSPMAIKAILDALTDSNMSNSLNRYPDGSGYYIKKTLSEKLSVDEDEIILGNGSNELIDLAVRTFMRFGDEAVMAHPSFIVYPMSVQAMGGKPVEVPLKNYTHDFDEMAEAVTSKTKVLFIGNPNNPTGTINKSDELERLMRRLPDGILVIVDEAYYEYVTDSDFADSMKYFRDGRDILILRTFSKIYGLAGLRIGYGIARKDIISEINKLRPPFNTSTIAQKAALWALKDNDHIRYTKQINEQGKKNLYKELKTLGLEYVPTEANFIYILLRKDANDLYNKLLKKGVIVRPVGPEEVRVTIGLPQENKRFIEALQKVIGQ
ncbi:MAG: histidinol-phosphate transaminase [Nitrospirae bacterium]|jgi:histidinol-phosphate aminotransferase|nr:histidinol-phosphate transaminase [Nitrospirota bacterium]